MPVRSRLLEFVLGLIWFVSAPLCAQDDAKTTRYRDKTGQVVLALPQNWTLEKNSTAAFPADSPTKIELSLRPQGWKGRLKMRIDIWGSGAVHAPSFHRNSLAYFAKSKQPHHKVEIVDKPWPHLVKTFGISGLYLKTFAVCKIKDRRFQFECDVDPVDLPRFQTHIRTVVEGLSYTGPRRYPLVREGREHRTLGSLEVSCQAGMRPGVDFYKRTVQALLKRFHKHHPEVQRPEGHPFMVYINPDRAAHERLLGKKPRSQIMWFSEGRLLVSTPFSETRDAWRSESVRCLIRGLLLECYGPSLPQWVSEGESLLAATEDGIKKKLPWVSAGIHSNLVHATQTLASFAKRPPVRSGAQAGIFDAQAAAWVALFRTGPRAYRKAYAAFLVECAQTGEGVRAQERHLLSLDQAKLLSDLKRLIKRLRRPKKR